MNWKLRLKTILFIVCSAAWIYFMATCVTGLNEAGQYSKKQPRNVVMLDAWSYSSGSSRDGYEGRFVDDQTGRNFTYKIEAYVYHAYLKNPIPGSMTINVSDNDVGSINADAIFIKYFLQLLGLCIIVGCFVIIQTALGVRKRGFLYELFMVISEWWKCLRQSK